jgi:type I restriction enzyme S subunit
VAIKNQPRTLTPKLRFPEFKAEGPWAPCPLDELCERILEKVGDAKLTPVSITAGRGFVSQVEKFGRDISGAQYKNYIRLRRGEFAYNRGNSNLYPQGCVYQLKEFDEAAASNAFICFRLKDGNAPGFFRGLFEKNAHGPQLLKFLTSGARSDGLLNISADEFFSVSLSIPPDYAEQRKIAACLTSLDELLAAEGRKQEALRAHKKGLMQRLFPRKDESRPRLRFPEFRDAGEWEETPLERVIAVASGQVDPTEPPHCDLPHVGGENIESESGYLQGIRSAREDGVISGKYPFDERDILYSKIRPALNKVAAPNFRGICSADIYPIRPSSNELRKDFLVYLLRSDSFVEHATKHSARGKIPKINREALLAYGALMPSPAEQQRIAACLGSLDALIASASRKLDGLRGHKKGLMQQLFPLPGGA